MIRSDMYMYMYIQCICLAVSLHVHMCSIYLLDVHVWQVGDEVVANQKTHQNPVINNALQVVAK